jgi:hypothetical protein
MPIWFIELFGSGDLDVTFMVITLMTAPFWIAMIGFPSAPYLRKACTALAGGAAIYGDTPSINLEVIPCGVFT